MARSWRPRPRRRRCCASCATAADAGCCRCPPRNTPQEYEIFYIVEYSVERAGKEVLEVQPLEMLRNMSFDDAQLLAKDREEAILREAMARDLALLVVRRLESL